MPLALVPASDEIGRDRDGGEIMAGLSGLDWSYVGGAYTRTLTLALTLAVAVAVAVALTLTLALALTRTRTRTLTLTLTLTLTQVGGSLALLDALWLLLAFAVL